MPSGIFISHISEEAPIAQVLKDWIEPTFSGQYRVFIGNYQGDIPAGSRWLAEIEQAIKSAVVFLVLCSPTSVLQPWINFETGCAWLKGVPILPLCHSGQMKDALPFPLSIFQALQIEASDFTQNLLSAVATHLGFSKVPRVM